MGNSLVSFNDVADESYGCVNDQGKNAPTGKFAAFAYTTALNHLLSDRDHVFRMETPLWSAGPETRNRPTPPCLEGLPSAPPSLLHGKRPAWNGKKPLRRTAGDL